MEFSLKVEIFEKLEPFCVDWFLFRIKKLNNKMIAYKIFTVRIAEKETILDLNHCSVKLKKFKLFIFPRFITSQKYIFFNFKCNFFFAINCLYFNKNKIKRGAKL